MIISDTVNKQMYEIIKSMILSNRMKPGEKIDPKPIADENKTSLMPVRNALQQLAAQELVIAVPRVGYFVNKFSNVELRQINDMRKLFELNCIQNHFENINQREAVQFVKRIEKTSWDNPHAQRELDSSFHYMIVEASRNKFLLKQYNDLSCLFYLSMSPLSAERWDIAQAEHLAILEAIIKNDAVDAYDCLVYHLDRVGRELVTQNNIIGGSEPTLVAK